MSRVCIYVYLQFIDLTYASFIYCKQAFEKGLLRNDNLLFLLSSFIYFQSPYRLINAVVLYLPQKWREYAESDLLGHLAGILSFGYL
jgi:hypothetical protein